MKKFRVYYMKPSHFRDGIMGRVTTDLNETHVFLKDLTLPDSAWLEQVYHEMQGEVWSPNGEAMGLIAQKGLQHTSMSTGDVIVYEGRAFAVCLIGFAELPRDVLCNMPDERGAVA